MQIDDDVAENVAQLEQMLGLDKTDVESFNQDDFLTRIGQQLDKIAAESSAKDSVQSLRKELQMSQQRVEQLVTERCLLEQEHAQNQTELAKSRDKFEQKLAAAYIAQLAAEKKSLEQKLLSTALEKATVEQKLYSVQTMQHDSALSVDHMQKQTESLQQQLQTKTKQLARLHQQMELQNISQTDNSTKLHCKIRLIQEQKDTVAAMEKLKKAKLSLAIFSPHSALHQQTTADIRKYSALVAWHVQQCRQLMNHIKSFE